MSSRIVILFIIIIIIIINILLIIRATHCVWLNCHLAGGSSSVLRSSLAVTSLQQTDISPLEKKSFSSWILIICCPQTQTKLLLLYFWGNVLRKGINYII